MTYSAVNMKNFLLLVFVSLFLVGCASTVVEKEVIIEHTYISYDIPRALKEPCIAKELMSEEDYMKLTPLGREAYLTTYVIDLLSGIKECGSKVSRINTLIEQQNKKLIPVNKVIGVTDGETVKQSNRKNN